MLWFVLAGLTGLAALSALWPLAYRKTGVGQRESETAFYRAQLAEIDRDIERGQLPPQEGAAARAEAARRLLAADGGDAATDAADPATRAAGRRRRILASCLILLFAPAISVGVYEYVGRPDLPDAPLAGRKTDRNSPEALQAAIAKIESHLARQPDDVKGWDVLAPVYMRMGRFEDAVAAYKQILRLSPETGALRAAYAEALLANAGGVVTQPARESLQRALADTPGLPIARFYLALAAEQDGDLKGAQATYEELAPAATGAEPWMMGLRARLAALKGGAAPDAAANAPQPGAEAPPAGGFSPEQQSMIRGMVERLATRLAQQGGGAEDWARLIRAYSVLQETDKAREALASARKAFANDAKVGADLDALARELGLGG